jgi:hypothetical protein
MQAIVLISPFCDTVVPRETFKFPFLDKCVGQLTIYFSISLRKSVYVRKSFLKFHFKPEIYNSEKTT